MHDVKPFTPEVRAEIDNELADKSIDFMKRQHAAGKPFFLYLPFSMGHAPTCPSKQFAGKSRIGNYGDKMMEGDYHVGQILDALKDLGVDDDTIVIFASDNGPRGDATREFGNQGTPDMGNTRPVPRRTGRSDGGLDPHLRLHPLARPRQAGHDFLRHVLDHGFLAHARAIVGGKMPTDRPIDGVDQSDVLFGKSASGHRENPAELHRPGVGGGALEAMARLFHRHASDRHRAAASCAAWSQPTRRWRATRRSTTSRWTRMRI